MRSNVKLSRTILLQVNFKPRNEFLHNTEPQGALKILKISKETEGLPFVWISFYSLSLHDLIQRQFFYSFLEIFEVHLI